MRCQSKNRDSIPVRIRTFSFASYELLRLALGLIQPAGRWVFGAVSPVFGWDNKVTTIFLDGQVTVHRDKFL
jgi:hypothetical protein